MVLPGKGIGWKQFFVAVKDEYVRDRIDDVAGSVTFFAVLALFPFVVFLIALAGTFIDPVQAQNLIEQLARFAPAQATNILADRIRDLATGSHARILSLAAIGAIWAASGGVVSVMSALNTVYGVKESRPFWKVRLIAIGVTLGAALLVLIAAPLMVVVPSVSSFIGRGFGMDISGLLEWIRFPIAGVLMMFLWACLYYFLPDVDQDFKFLTPGSVIGVLLWLAASWGFSLYVKRFGTYDAIYGTLGGAIVLLMWMWISSQVVLVGAEVNAVLEHKSPEGKAAGARHFGQIGAAGATTQTKTELEHEVGNEAHLPGASELKPELPSGDAPRH